jgi:hypothetical protein
MFTISAIQTDDCGRVVGAVPLCSVGNQKDLDRLTELLRAQEVSPSRGTRKEVIITHINREDFQDYLETGGRNGIKPDPELFVDQRFPSAADAAKALGVMPQLLNSALTEAKKLSRADDNWATAKVRGVWLMLYEDYIQTLMPTSKNW